MSFFADTDQLSYGRSYSLNDDDARALNHYGQLQHVFSRAIARSQERNDINQTSLAAFKRCLARNGMGAIKPRRHWCSRCYADARFVQENAFDMLMIQICEIDLCPIHLRALTDKCPHCAADQHHLPKSGVLDCCQSCGGWLGQELSPNAAIEVSAYQNWLLRELPLLLSARSSVEERADGSECGFFLRSIVKARGVSQRELSAQIKVPLDTLQSWMRSRTKPKLTSWLRVCANLSVSPASTFLDPYEAARQLPLPFSAPRIYSVTRGRPIKKYDKESIKKAVSDQLKLSTPSLTTVKALCDSLSAPYSMVYFHAPEEIKEFVLLLKELRTNKRRSRNKVISKAAFRLANRMQKENQPLIRKTFSLALSKRIGCGVHRAKDEFSIVLKKLSAS